MAANDFLMLDKSNTTNLNVTFIDANDVQNSTDVYFSPTRLNMTFPYNTCLTKSIQKEVFTI